MLTLVIGGCYQCKTEYVMKQYQVEEKEMTEGEQLEWDTDSACILHLNRYFRKALQGGMRPEELERQTLSYLQKRAEVQANLVITSDEIGYGVVPMDAFEREYREVTGRIMCKVAQMADTVIRVTLGMGTKIKG